MPSLALSLPHPAPEGSNTPQMKAAQGRGCCPRTPHTPRATLPTCSTRNLASPLPKRHTAQAKQEAEPPRTPPLKRVLPPQLWHPQGWQGGMLGWQVGCSSSSNRSMWQRACCPPSPPQYLSACLLDPHPQCSKPSASLKGPQQQQQKTGVSCSACTRLPRRPKCSHRAPLPPTARPLPEQTRWPGALAGAQVLGAAP